MLSEFPKTRQIPGEGLRRWFSDSNMDLIVWYDEAGQISGFQLCYNKTSDEHAFTWRRGQKYTHDTIDAGERPMSMNMTPILVADGYFPKEKVAEQFRSLSFDLEPDLRDFILEKIMAN